MADVAGKFCTIHPNLDSPYLIHVAYSPVKITIFTV